MIDEDITWNDQIYTIKKKLAKNIDFSYRVRRYQIKESFKIIISFPT